jgi:hydrogenase maturation protein HypF
VARVIDGTAQLTRRGKGYTPVPVYVKGTERLTKDVQIFAAGGHLKSVFSLSKGSFVYLSQHIGDLDNIETEHIYEDNFNRMKTFFSIRPQLVVCDLHPLYYTTRYAEVYVKNIEDKIEPSPICLEDKIEPSPFCLLRVQHHHAHIASVIAEHGLSGSVIGVSFDGTGYGTDGRIWGGEILICKGAHFERFAHLRYVKMIGGDTSMKEGWKSAISHTLAAGTPMKSEDAAASMDFDVDISEIIEYSRKYDTLKECGQTSSSAGDAVHSVEAAIKNGINTVETSSMGRLFDAVASLLGIHHINRYEGECAIMLENAAFRALKRELRDLIKDEMTDRRTADDSDGVRQLADRLALKFHRDVAKVVLDCCRSAREEDRKKPFRACRKRMV